MIIQTSFMLALALAGPAPLPSPSQIDAFAKAQFASAGAPGMSVAVVQKGIVVFAKGYGFADLENRVKASPKTVYRIGSVTKQFTAAMILQLVQEGKLTLDEPARQKITDLPEAWSGVTVRHLLNHTSGIKSYTSLLNLFIDLALKPTTPRAIVKTVETYPLEFAPGTKWNYNNTGYEILGLLIEKLDGRPFADSLRERITKPLGMNQTYFVSERDLVPNRAKGYSSGKNGFRHAPYLDMSWPYAAGSMESTVLDLAKWDAALYGDKILSAASKEASWTETKLADGKVQGYGFGWGLDKVNSVQTISHGGGIHGFLSMISRTPSASFTTIVLMNTDSPSKGVDPGKVSANLNGFLDPRQYVAPPKAIADPDPATTVSARKVLEDLVGGKLDRARLTARMAAMLTPERIEDTKDQLGGKPIRKFELLKAEGADGQKVRTYRVLIGDETVTYQITFDKAGLIDSLGLRPG